LLFSWALRVSAKQRAKAVMINDFMVCCFLLFG
jgi:hypothetical protein